MPIQHDRQPIRWNERIATIMVGRTAKTIEEILFDWLLYGVVAGFFALKYDTVEAALRTLVVMAPLSAIVCLGYIKAYDILKMDWLGFEAFKEVTAGLEGKGVMRHLKRRMFDAGTVTGFLALSVWGDPFEVTVALRKRDNQYQGLTARDWKIFFLSVLSTNGFWTAAWIFGWQIPSLADVLFRALPVSWQAWLAAQWEGVAPYAEPFYQVIKGWVLHALALLDRLPFF